MAYYITSDQHFFHKNIIDYENRPYSSVEEMNEDLITKWNSVVSNEDTVFCLGDFALSNKDNIIEIGNRLFRSPSGKSILKDVESHTLHYGFVIENEEENKSHWKDYVIDEVMAAVMKAPKSFTGEDTVEIQCHGGVFVMQKILMSVLSAGARLAEPGEFTKRAFLNGRIDLTKAEAVMDVIHSQNEYALEASVGQLKGNLYEKIQRYKKIYT